MLGSETFKRLLQWWHAYREERARAKRLERILADLKRTTRLEDDNERNVW